MTTIADQKPVVWKCHRKNSMTMVYGFKTNDRHYDVVMTLHHKNDSTAVYGFLSKVRLTFQDFQSLWRKLLVEIDTEYLLFEVLPEHAVVYRQFLPVESVERTCTFNNLQCEVIKVRLRE